MTKANDRVTIIRPGEIVALTFDMVPVPESETAATSPVSEDKHAGRNGKTKAARSKPRKKKPTRRRKA